MSHTMYVDEPERGAIVARMAPSWLRFGNFEIFYSRDDMENVRVMADYAIENVVKDEMNGTGNKYGRFLRNVTKKTAIMVAEWQAAGFNHGVMNTDNMSILGLTMDYGPFQMMDYYNPHYVCNHSDETGRKYHYTKKADNHLTITFNIGYAYHRQPSVCIFNLVKLSVPLFELIGAGEDVDSIVFPDKNNETKEGVTDEQTLEKYRDAGKVFVQEMMNNEFKDYFMEHLSQKLRSRIGLSETFDVKSDMDDVIIPMLDWMATYHVDHHRFYRSLSNYQITKDGEDSDSTKAISEWLDIVTEDENQVDPSKEALKPWLAIYRHRLLKEKVGFAERKERMDAVNPRFILRNSIAEKVIQAFDETETEEEAQSVLNACLDACVNPFKDHYEDERVETWITETVPVST